jgi:hypothetical protein
MRSSAAVSRQKTRDEQTKLRASENYHFGTFLPKTFTVNGALSEEIE